MKKYYYTILALLLLALFWGLISWPKARDRKISNGISIEKPNAAPSQLGSGSENGTAPKDVQSAVLSDLPMPRESYSYYKVIKVATEDQVRALFEVYNSPIDFWGKVVDEKGNPISGAKVSFGICNHPERDSQKIYVLSDVQGLFSLTEKRGASLFVGVTKSGYYELDQSAATIEYAMRGRPGIELPTKDNPTIFVLKKKGAGAALVKYAGDSTRLKGVSSIEFDLTTGRVAATGKGDLIVTIESDLEQKNGQGRYPWRASVSVKGGGMALQQDRLDFQAPAAGYQSAKQISYGTEGDRWSNSETCRYFVKLANNTYALLNMDVYAGASAKVILGGYYNPKAGDRNLEYDPSKVVSSTP